MSGLTLTVSLDDDDFRRVMAEGRLAGENLRPLMTIAGGIFENSTRDRFDQERGPGGIPWPQSWRAREEGGKTLTDTGLLRGSVRSEYGDDWVETGVDGRDTAGQYAASHQWGVTIRPTSARALAFTAPDGTFRMVTSVTLPARPFMGIDDEDLLDLQDAFTDYLGGAFSGN